MMQTLFLESPKLSASVSVPDDLSGGFRRNFAAALIPVRPESVDHEYQVHPVAAGFALSRDGVVLATFPTAPELMFAFEEELENTLIARLGGWVGLHAGAVALGDLAIITVGHPDTGKTTSTFQLVELGLELLCEEVTPVDPATCLVHPFPGVLTFSRRYAEAFASQYPVTRGELSFHGPDMARYQAARVRRQPTRAGVVLMPSYDPSCDPGLDEVAPPQVLTDLLQYCFDPTVSDEQLFDSMIRVVERCRVFRMRTRDIASARTLLGRLIADLQSPDAAVPTRSRSSPRPA